MNDTMPMMFDHCCLVFNTMKKTAKNVDGHLVWEGFLTRLINEQLNFATPYYTSIRKELRRMGCVHQLRRGGSSTPSQWELLKEPTVDLYQQSPQRRSDHVTILDSIDQRVVDLTKRVATLERLLEQGIVFTKESA